MSTKLLVIISNALHSTGGRDFNSSVRVARFDEGDSEVSTCITLFDDQLCEGDEVFSVLLSVPNVPTLEPGLCVLATVTIIGTCIMYMVIFM